MTNNTLERLPLLASDLVVEVVGSEVRFWTVFVENGKTRVRHIGRSYSCFRSRYLQSMCVGGCASMEARQVTSARIYNRKDRRAGAVLALEAARILTGEEPKVVHLFYNGRGPSGNLWNFANEDYYSVRR